MYYVIFAKDVEGSLESRTAARPAHLERLDRLQSEGRLLTAGPLPAIDTNEPGLAGYAGSLIIAAFDSLEDAEAWAKQDPYFEAGVYRKVSVYPYRQVFPR